MSNRYPLSPAPLTCLNSSERRRFNGPFISAVRRRHHRRRLLKKYAPDSAPPSTPIPTIFKLSDDTLQISLKPTLNSFQRLEARLNEFLDFGREAFDDLRTVVAVDRTNGGFTISCRRSTVELLVAVLASSFVAVIAIRGLFKSRKSVGEVLIYKRDRSLGGREVVVGRKETNWPTSRELTPLSSDNGDNYRRERNRATTDRRKKEELPQWWPQVVNSGSDDAGNTEEYQRMVNQLVQAIMDRKMAGEDVSTNDIVQLRHVCKTYGVRVTISTENSRNSLYRVSINFVLNFCESISNVSASSIDSIQINGEDVREFVAGLADNIGLESAHAVRIVSAAVAARTRSKILQAWALEVQNKHSEALDELFKVCLIHRIFPPKENSPEMEMVARGLDKSLSTEQREYILNSFITICGDDIDQSVVEALGLN